MFPMLFICFKLLSVKHCFSYFGPSSVLPLPAAEIEFLKEGVRRHAGFFLKSNLEFAFSSVFFVSLLCLHNLAKHLLSQRLRCKKFDIEFGRKESTKKKKDPETKKTRKEKKKPKIHSPPLSTFQIHHSFLHLPPPLLSKNPTVYYRSARIILNHLSPNQNCPPSSLKQEKKLNPKKIYHNQLPHPPPPKFYEQKNKEPPVSGTHASSKQGKRKHPHGKK